MEVLLTAVVKIDSCIVTFFRTDFRGKEDGGGSVLTHITRACLVVTVTELLCGARLVQTYFRCDGTTVRAENRTAELPRLCIV